VHVQCFECLQHASISPSNSSYTVGSERARSVAAQDYVLNGLRTLSLWSCCLLGVGFCRFYILRL